MQEIIGEPKRRQEVGGESKRRQEVGGEPKGRQEVGGLEEEEIEMNISLKQQKRFTGEQNRALKIGVIKTRRAGERKKK